MSEQKSRCEHALPLGCCKVCQSKRKEVQMVEAPVDLPPHQVELTTNELLDLTWVLSLRIGQLERLAVQETDLTGLVVGRCEKYDALRTKLDAHIF